MFKNIEKSKTLLTFANRCFSIILNKNLWRRQAE